MGSQFPVKTGIAHIVDTDVANSIDFHIAASSYTNTLDKYLGEIALVYFHNYTFYKNNFLIKYNNENCYNIWFIWINWKSTLRINSS